MSDSKPLAKLALEVVLITVGVFLALMVDQWREGAAHREAAQTALHRFRTEIATNRDAIAAVKDYHVQLKAQAEAYLAADAAGRKTTTVNLRGVRIVMFERTAWDLAIATQALTYMNPDLAFALSRTYGAQDMYTTLTNGFTQAMYLRPPGENLEAFLRTLGVYYGDLVVMEPKLLAMYEEILPAIDRALGNTSAQRAPGP